MKITETELKNELQLALAICAHDGWISEAELEVLKEHYCDQSDLTQDKFERAIDEFFGSEAPIEVLLSAVSDKEKTLELAEIAASADGLDQAENWALVKCRRLIELGLADI